jgi:glycosyltransferase involved in cell wall biosynthesis
MFKDRAKELGIEKQVKFSGGLRGKPLVKKYQEAAVHVLPSTTNAESFGMVLLEANASGTPVIGSKIGGIIQVIEDKKNGLIVEPRNEKDLAKAITFMLDSPAKAAEMGAAGRKKAVEEYQWSRQIDLYNNLFTKILNTRRVYQITAYYPPNLGGMQNCAKILSEAMAKKEMPVTVLTSNVSYKGKSHIHPDKKLDVVYCSSFEFAHTPFSLQYVWELMKVKKPAVFHLHVANAFFVDLAYLTARIKNIPYVAHIHIDPDPSGSLGFLLPLYKNLVLKPLLTHASKIICLTESQKVHFIKKYGLKKDTIVVIHNGVGKEYYIKRSAQNKKVTQILFVGRLSVQKNIPLLLEAVKMVQSNVELHIVGEGPDRENIQNKIKQLDLNNVFLDGAKYGQDLINMYRQADIFFFPTNNEGMSLALLEAMAAGIPIVTSGLDQNKELIQKGAVYVNKQDPKHYAEAIDDLIKKPRALETMSITNQQSARAFSWDNVVAKILEVYKEI